MTTRRRAGVAAGILALTLAACSAPPVASGPAPGATGDPAPAPAGSSADPTGVGVTGRVPAVRPVGVVAAGTAVWVASAGAGALRRVEPTPNLRTEVGATPLRLAYDGRHVWGTVFGAGTVVALDPTTGKIVTTVALDGQPEGVAVGAGAIWVVRQAARRLTRLAPDGTVGPSWPTGVEPRLVAVSSTAVFVANYGDGTVTRLDLTRRTLTTSGQLCDGAQGLAVTPDVLWVTCTAAGVVLAVDPRTLRVRGRIEGLREPDAVHVVGDEVWVAEAVGPALLRLTADPDVPTVARRYTVDTLPGLADRANVDFAVVGQEFWISAPQSGLVYRLTPPA